MTQPFQSSSFTMLISSSASLFPPLLQFNEAPLFPPNLIGIQKPKITTVTHRRFASTENQRLVVASPTAAEDAGREGLKSASEVVRSFYAGINGHDLSSVEDLIAHNCVYEDLVFPRPFVGRKAILDFFKKFTDSTSRDLQFIIDDISPEDSSAIGVTWHLEWKGRPFPFSKGCSFYRIEVFNGKLQIVYGRDCVEPAIKPGESVLGVIRAVTWLLQQFPQLADRL